MLWPGVDPATVEAAMDDVMAEFTKRGPNPKLLKAEKQKYLQVLSEEFKG